MKPIAILEADGTLTDEDIWERVLRRDKEDFVEFRAAGGPGSGNFGHEGRPGEIGGSGPGGGEKKVGKNIKKVAFGSEYFQMDPSDMSESFNKTFNLGMSSEDFYTKKSQERMQEEVGKIAASLVEDVNKDFEVRVIPYTDSVKFQYLGLDKDGNPDTNIEREFQRDSATGELIVDHSYFNVRDQRAGLAKEVLQSSFEEYDRLGVDRVELIANINVGQYAWARFGFIPNSQGQARQVYERAARAMRELDPTNPLLKETEKQLDADEVDREFIWKIADDKNGFTWLARNESYEWHGVMEMKNMRQRERLAKYLSGKLKK